MNRDIEARLEERIDIELRSPRWLGLLEPDQVTAARQALRNSLWADINRLDIALDDLRQAIREGWHQLVDRVGRSIRTFGSRRR